MSVSSRLVWGGAAAVFGLAVLLVNDDPGSLRAGKLMPEANAVIGRPLTPMSYAGVARRTTRRAVAVGAAGTATVIVAPAPVVVAPAPVVVAPAPVVMAPAPVRTCVQAVDAYGRIYVRCY